MLAMAACEAVSGFPPSAVDFGCALELVHAFSLIHDDLPAIDDDDLRRGLPTCHKVYGEAMAILAGDALFALAFRVAAGAHPDPARCATLVTSLAFASGSVGLVGGEVMDIQAEGAELDPVRLKEIHARKTGALIAASCYGGAIVGGASESEADLLEEFGQAVGLAFQIHDDVLNETSTPEQLGKAVGSDRARKKLTYPAVVGLDQAVKLAEEATDAALALLEPFGERAGTLREIAVFAIRRDS
jgi:geranylgeranyl diphosphate synthase type II